MKKLNEVGFSQRIRLEWLAYTADLVLAGYGKKEIKAALEELLKDKLSAGRDKPTRGNREKAISVLLKIWVSPPKNLVAFRDDGLELLRRLPREQHLPVHWGMSMAVYPFMATVAEVVGRLLRLHETVTWAQIQRRLQEELGERATVNRAAQRTVRCFVDWGVLEDTERKGVYRAAAARRIEDEKLMTWLVEAVLIASDSEARPLSSLVSAPALFPFVFASPFIDVSKSAGRLALFRQGLQKDMVVLLGRG